jgi:hypothetical protein
MSLCTACVLLSEELSEVISNGLERSAKRFIRHGRPLQELRYDEANDCLLCHLLQTSYVREAEDEPLDNSFAVEIKPVWDNRISLRPGRHSADPISSFEIYPDLRPKKAVR